MNKVLLRWIEIAILWVILEYTQKHDKPPTQADLVGKTSLIWVFLQTNRIDKIYSGNFSPKTTSIIVNCVRSLRQSGLLIPVNNHEPTAAASKFFEIIGTDWKAWPAEVYVRNGVPDLKNVLYFPKFEEN